METQTLLDYISRGRTDLIFQLLKQAQWKEVLMQGNIKPLQWLVYYDDITALKAVLEAGSTLDSLDLDQELGMRHFLDTRRSDFLIRQGANVRASVPATGETPLHSALSKAGRPYYFNTVQLLVEKGADINARTIPGIETQAFMRDVRTKGETPLHRAAAYAEEKTMAYLLDHGADRESKDSHGDSPLTWASEHLRPGSILSLLSFSSFTIGAAHKIKNTSDHGQGWGNGMDWNLFGEYLPE